MMMMITIINIIFNMIIIIIIIIIIDIIVFIIIIVVINDMIIWSLLWSELFMPSGPPRTIFQTLRFVVFAELELHRLNQEMPTCLFSKGLFFDLKRFVLTRKSPNLQEHRSEK